MPEHDSVVIGASAGGLEALTFIVRGLPADCSARPRAINSRGGIVVVHDPADAAHPDLPMAAIDFVNVDHIASLATMPDLAQAG